MNKPQQSSGHEDDDPLVVAAIRCCAEADILRKPGLIVFGVRRIVLGEDGKSFEGCLVVRRSRFEGVYGNICRITFSSGDGADQITFAPTDCVAEALRSVRPGDAFEALSKVYVEWFKKGDE